MNRVTRPVAVLGLAAVLLGSATLLARSQPAGTAPAVPVVAASATGLAALEARVARVPADWNAWAALAAGFVEQSRIDADPSYYPKAAEAAQQSLALQPTGNAPALSARAALKAAKHDFRGALADAQAARDINPFNAATLGVLCDALVELGRFDEADAVVQRMVDLKPGISSFTRVSYVRELRGDVAGARHALTRALAIAFTPDSIAFVEYYLGELEWNAGNLDAADGHFRRGLLRDPGSSSMLGGRAKVAAARGDVTAALRDYRTIVSRGPSPFDLVELGELLESAGNAAEAAENYRLVEAAQQVEVEQGVNFDLEIAQFHADHGDPAIALAAAGREIARRTGLHVEDAYAWALHRNGRDQEALLHADRALRLGSRSALFHYHRGVIKLSLGREDAARADLARALELNPHFSPLESAEARRLLADTSTVLL